jgi:hypothetical protein
MRRDWTQIVCDICQKEVAEVAGTSMYRPNYIQSLEVRTTDKAEAYYDICGHCSDGIIAKIEGMKP